MGRESGATGRQPVWQSGERVEESTDLTRPETLVRRPLRVTIVLTLLREAELRITSTASVESAVAVVDVKRFFALVAVV